MPMKADDITGLLQQIRSGRKDLADQVMNAVYTDLRMVARRRMAGERPDHTLQPTALVHEAYLRIFQGSDIDWQDRAHFFAVAAMQMRRVLADHGREFRAAKRGEGLKVMLDDTFSAAPSVPCEFDVVDELLERLHRVDPKAAKVVELKFFGGLSDREVAEVTGQSFATIRRHWIFARAWLASELSPA
ncbi:MAG: ECF-type sigma factor [Bryobacteraceae bacterium]